MRKRKGSRSESSASTSSSSPTVKLEEEALKLQQKQQHQMEEEEEEGSEGQHGFFACYLLASLNPRFKGHTYIGFTVNPRRRIRQHNGEIGCGAWRTKKKRPWEMVLCIYGFPTNVSALQFEWAWQHPVESLAVRKAAAGFKSLSGIANKIKLAYTMLTLPSWQSMNMTVHFFSTKHMKHCGGCPGLPECMKVEIGSMDELPCYTERIDGGLAENENDSIDEVEFNNNNTSNSDPLCDDDSSIHDSSKSPNHGDKISESLGRYQEFEAREPVGPSSQPFGCITTSPKSKPFGCITTSPKSKPSPAALSKRVEIIEDTEFASLMNNSSSIEYKISESLGRNQESEAREEPVGHSLAATQDRSQQPFGSITLQTSKPSSATSSKRVQIIEAEIIDLSTPSPSCRNVLDSKKRRTLCAGAEFIDLTKSPNFVQL